MKYADALRVLARLEGVPEEEVEAVVGQKFEYVVSCQIYNKLRSSTGVLDLRVRVSVRAKVSLTLTLTLTLNPNPNPNPNPIHNQVLDRWKAQCIDALRHEFAHNLKVAYVDATRARPGVLTRTGAAEEFSSVLLGVDPLSGDEQVPGSP